MLTVGGRVPLLTETVTLSLKMQKRSATGSQYRFLSGEKRNLTKAIVVLEKMRSVKRRRKQRPEVGRHEPNRPRQKLKEV